jgi:predicted alpha-1,2-mannosidase
MKRCTLLLLFGCLSAVLWAQTIVPPAEEVDPYIGTAHCRWFHFTPGAVPFGMAKPAPSTNGHYGNKWGWEAVGYDYRDSSIEGFANFHEFQVGGIVFMPTTGKLKTIPGKLEHKDLGYRSAFDHKNEVAKPGYYSVLLDDYGIKAELTSTPRVAFHRYTFPAGRSSHILFDVGNRQGESGRVKEAQVYMTPEGAIEGYVITLPEYVQKYQQGASVAMYFSAVLDKKPSSSGVFKGSTILPGVDTVNGEGAGLYLTFSTSENESVTIKAGLSLTSIAQARQNREAEAASLSFEQAKETATKTWNDYLGRVRVEGGQKSDRVKFYTGLYHALLGRGLASDVNGAYPKNDGSVGQIALDKNGRPVHNHYNTDAIWGGFWNLTPLWALAYPEYYSDWIKSQLLVYKDAGWLGDGIASSKYVSGVGTNFVGLVMAGAYQYGIRDFDVQQAYAAALKNELEWRGRPAGAGKDDVERYVKYGYVNHIDPVNGEWCFSGSHTLEYSFSAHAVAQWAKALGKKGDYEKLHSLSKGWEKIFDTASRFVRPRYSDGRFVDNFSPSEGWRGFQEGNAWQYTFYVPHDPVSLVRKVGQEEFNHRLDSIFTISQKAVFGGGKNIHAFAGVEGLYNHGNQPCLHIPWLFNYSGKPWLTQKWVRAICNEFYGTEGVHGYGYGQDEDQGQLGAWYVLGAIGLFDVQGGAAAKPVLQLSSPLFDKVTIQLNRKYYPGERFTIIADQNSPQNIYIQSASLNGKALAGPHVDFSQVVKGGTLRYTLGSTPNTQFK